MTLLRNNLSYGNEIQKLSGVPGSKIYETLASLVEKGLLYPSGDSPVRYQPLPLDDYVNYNIKKHKRITDYLIENKDLICENKYPGWLWQIQGYENLMDKARELIDKAKKKILISFWYDDGINVQTQLQNAENRGVEIVTNQMSQKIIPIGTVFKHVRLPRVEKSHLSEFILVVDNLYCMFVVKNQNQKNEGYYTSNEGIIRIIESYVRHDIYVNKIICDFEEAVMEKYGDDLNGLADF